jgi:hypothetical protein
MIFGMDTMGASSVNANNFCPLRLASESPMAMACILLLSRRDSYYGRAVVEALSENL